MATTPAAPFSSCASLRSFRPCTSPIAIGCGKSWDFRDDQAQQGPEWRDLQLRGSACCLSATGARARPLPMMWEEPTPDFAESRIACLLAVQATAFVCGIQLSNQGPTSEFDFTTQPMASPPPPGCVASGQLPLVPLMQARTSLQSSAPAPFRSGSPRLGAMLLRALAVGPHTCVCAKRRCVFKI
jgi:hypothetical protein